MTEDERDALLAVIRILQQADFVKELSDADREALDDAFDVIAHPSCRCELCR